jgi:hypothetical protein
MELHDVARVFDNDALYDAYTGEYLFDGQLSSYDDSTSDGATIRRRILSFAPEYSLPDRRVVAIYGEHWLAGAHVDDGFQGTPIRRQATLKRADHQFNILTPSQACTAASGTLAYAQRLYFKDTANALTDAEYDAFWNIFFAPSEPIVKGTFLRDEGGTLYRVRNNYLPTEGLRVCQCDELDSNARLSVVFDSGTYNPVTETRSGGTTTVNGIWVELPKFFRFRHRSEQDTQAGDISVFIPTSYTPKVGDTFTMDGLKWQVLTFQAELDAWALHARLV